MVVVLVGLGLCGGQVWLERKATKTELPRPTVGSNRTKVNGKILFLIRAMSGLK